MARDCVLALICGLLEVPHVSRAPFPAAGGLRYDDLVSFAPRMRVVAPDRARVDRFKCRAPL